jgi:hypothetical protein
MICTALLLAGFLAVQKPAERPATAADRITLRDGSVVLGLVTATAAGPRAGLEILVRRDWAEKNVGSWAKKWNRALEANSKSAARQRRDRLQAWRGERISNAPADDRILVWIDRERKRLDDPSRFARSFLIPVHLSRGDVRSLTREPKTSARLLQLGWLCGIQDVETKKLDSLKDALEGRGFSAESDETPSIAGLLPLTPESELQWLARRAATELAFDSDLRFIRYQDLVLPDAKGGQALQGAGLQAAFSEIAKLLNPDHASGDPLAATLKKVGDRGRAGVLVTRLEMSADLSRVTVEATLWVRQVERWLPIGSRTASVRPDDLRPEAGQNLDADPQVQTAFSLVDALGLGSISPELKRRSLRMGAATEKALGDVRSQVNQDLDALSLPLSGPAGKDRRDPEDKR